MIVNYNKRYVLVDAEDPMVEHPIKHPLYRQLVNTSTVGPRESHQRYLLSGKSVDGRVSTRFRLTTLLLEVEYMKYS